MYKVEIEGEPGGFLLLQEGAHRPYVDLVPVLPPPSVMRYSREVPPPEQLAMPFVRIGYVMGCRFGKVSATVLTGHEHVPKLLEWWPPNSLRKTVGDMQGHWARITTFREELEELDELTCPRCRATVEKDLSSLRFYRDQLETVLRARKGDDWVFKWSFYKWNWREMLEQEPDPSIMY